MYLFSKPHPIPYNNPRNIHNVSICKNLTNLPTLPGIGHYYMRHKNKFSPNLPSLQPSIFPILPYPIPMHWEPLPTYKGKKMYYRHKSENRPQYTNSTFSPTHQFPLRHSFSTHETFPFSKLAEYWPSPIHH